MKKHILLVLSLLLIASMVVACNPEVVKYKVTYDFQGDISQSGEYAEGEEFLLYNSDDIVKNGFTFVGWNDGEKTYAPGSKYKMPAKDVKFTIVWESNKQLEGIWSGGKVDSSKLFGGNGDLDVELALKKKGDDKLILIMHISGSVAMDNQGNGQTDNGQTGNGENFNDDMYNGGQMMNGEIFNDDRMRIGTYSDTSNDDNNTRNINVVTVIELTSENGVYKDSQSGASIEFKDDKITVKMPQENSVSIVCETYEALGSTTFSGKYKFSSGDDATDNMAEIDFTEKKLHSESWQTNSGSQSGNDGQDDPGNQSDNVVRDTEDYDLEFEAIGKYVAIYIRDSEQGKNELFAAGYIDKDGNFAFSQGEDVIIFTKVQA